MELASWEPATDWDELPPTDGQLRFLKQHHIDVERIKYRGLATRMITRLLQRLKSGLCSYQQLTFLHNLGFTEKDTVLMTRAEASALIDKTLKEKEARRAEAKRASDAARGI